MAAAAPAPPEETGQKISTGLKAPHVSFPQKGAESGNEARQRTGKKDVACYGNRSS